MKKLFFLILSFLALNVASAQSPKAPKLVVGIVVDQMRYDYIFKYWNKFGDKGFRKLYREGFFCRNTNFNYVPTYTGPGHASIYTGTTPSVHGIIANNWYSRAEKRLVYCTEDKTAQPLLGTPKEGQMSPRPLLATTFCDELKLATNMRSKVIGVSIKDRGAILPAGHLSDMALWFSNEGKWISSNYYMKELPAWVIAYNKKNAPAKYLEKPWETLLPIKDYTEATADDVPWEGRFQGEDKSSFPHNLSEGFKKSQYDVLRYTPFGNTLTKEIAIEALKNEDLGKDEFTDILAVSFSSTDYVGHRFGPSSIEVEDTYIRLDKDLEEFIAILESTVGKENFLLFLTADHAAPDAPAYLTGKRIPSGNTSREQLMLSLKSMYHRVYGDSLVKSVYNQQVFLDKELIGKKNLDLMEIKKKGAEFLRNQPNMSEVFIAEDLISGGVTGKFPLMIQAGYNLQRSGDIIYNYQPLWMELEFPGTTHGSPYSYDSHVPLFFYGSTVVPGSTMSPIDITDIAPTVCQFLNITYPSGCVGTPVKELFPH